MDHTVVGVRGPRFGVEDARVEQSRESPPSAKQGREDDAELRELANQLQGVFIQQLFKAMRDTVPQNGSAFGRAGSEMFSGIMDEHLAEAASIQLEKGLGQAIYRQLSATGQLPDSDRSRTESQRLQGDPGTVGGAGEDLT